MRSSTIRSEQLLPGQFVNVTINAGQRDNVFLVPQPSVIQTEKANLVFVVDAQGKARSADGADRRLDRLGLGDPVRTQERAIA